MMQKKTAKRIIEYCVVAFFQTMLLITLNPELRMWPAALVATVTLVTALVLVFEYFYDDPVKDDPDR